MALGDRLDQKLKEKLKAKNLELKKQRQLLKKAKAQNSRLKKLKVQQKPERHSLLRGARKRRGKYTLAATKAYTGRTAKNHRPDAKKPGEAHSLRQSALREQ